MTHETVINLSDYPKRRSSASASPFRYPGGKGFLTGYLASQIANLPIHDRIYVEAFCGGAGAAVNLLQDKVVSEIHLNDLDPRMFSAWAAMVNENERFLERIRNVEIDVATWRNCRELVMDPPAEYDFEVGFATFFLNRTSRGGIILGSGPTGGYDQTGNWKIDARFYRETVLRRIGWIGEHADRIKVTNQPALAFLTDHAKNLNFNNTFYFIDPPYVVAGSRLYLDAMNFQDHRSLACFLTSERLQNWVLTYDDDPLIRKLYGSYTIRQLEVNYSLSRIRKENEVVIGSS